MEGSEVTGDNQRTEGSTGGGLTDELSRLTSVKSESQSIPGPSAQTRLLCEERHDAGDDGADARKATDGVASTSGAGSQIALKWRQKEKLKTTAVALVLCLNIGVDPPDVIKISPCARLECWVDPLSMQPAKALETIGKNLQAQYERWQPKAKYKMHLDPTVEDVKKLAMSCRRNAKNERILFHYNGHGVPRPTANGEIWVFNSRYTQYIPLSVYELQSWLGTPCIYVLDCSSAGVVINSFRAFMDQRSAELRAASGYPGGAPPGTPGIPGSSVAAAAAAAAAASDPMREIILLAACGANEVLPQNPELPADVFTACLTTPIKVSLRWFCSRSLLRHDGITKELIDRIPGRQTDRKTPLGELNWIFTAITDTIAWNVLPRTLFQKLFRSDLLVASLFRNFLLAERIMAAANCTPVSYPRLPPTHQHPMWQAWDMAAEQCLMQLPTLLSDTAAEFQPSPFFAEQLTAFELWLTHGSRDKKPPEQLPIVLQVLLSQVHRLRALVLLGRFLDMGPWAVDLALSVGIFPYVLKLLQTTSNDLRATLVFIWAKILALDRSCQVDLVKDAGHTYFIKYLDTMDGNVDLHSRAQAAFVLAAICDGHPKGQGLCATSNLLAVLLKWLRTMFPPQVPFASASHALLLKWLCLCLGKLCQDMPEISLMAIREGAADLLVQLLTVASPEIRAAAVFGLGCLVHSGSTSSGVVAAGDEHAMHMQPPTQDRLPAEQLIANAVRQVVYDPSVLVRCELAVLYARFVRGHGPYVQEALQQQQRKLHEFARTHLASMVGAGANARPSLESSSSLPLGEEGPRSASDTVGAARARSNSGLGTQGGSEPQSRSGSTPLPPNAPGAAAGTNPAFRAPSTYTALLESIQMLALDPSPKVARLGRDVLRITQCEINFVGTGISGNGSLSPMHAQGSGSLGTFTQKLRPRGWGRTPSSGSATAGTLTPGASSVGGSGTAAGTSAGAAVSAGPGTGALPTTHGSLASTPSSSSPPSPTRESAAMAFSRHPYVLRTTGDMGLLGDGLLDSDPFARSSVGPGVPSSPGGGMAGGPGGYGAGQGGLLLGGGAAPSQDPLPASIVYGMSCEAFSRPMLEPQASAWRDGEIAAVAPWAAPVDPARRAFRVREVETAIMRCRGLTAPKLREQVFSVETSMGHGSGAQPAGEGAHAHHLATVAFHPYHPLVCCADGRGFIKVSNFNDSTCINAFHVASGVAPADSRSHPPPASAVLNTSVTFLQQINEADGPMLLAGSADGAVRVWRSYTLPGSQRLATALQAVTIHLPPQTGRATAFGWSPARSHLFAAGGSHPDMIYCWDLRYEMCSNMIPMSSSSSTASGSATSHTPAPAVDRISIAPSDRNLVLAGCADATVRLFDVRAARAPVLMLAPFRQPAVGIVFEPAGKAGIIVAASEKGELKLMDTRMASGTLAGAQSAGVPPSGLQELTTAATIKTVNAHSKGGLSALVAHAYAPLMATGTANQVVKVWTDTCEVVGAIRAQATLTAHKMGPVTCMAWHPYQPLLAAGGGDSVCAVYAIDQNTTAAKQMQSSQGPGSSVSVTPMPSIG